MKRASAAVAPDSCGPPALAICFLLSERSLCRLRVNPWTLLRPVAPSCHPSLARGSTDMRCPLSR
eukprot:1133884-Rhodomonas_salina.2